MLLLEAMAKQLHLHLGHIEDELHDVQRPFPAINAVLWWSRLFGQENGRP